MEVVSIFHDIADFFVRNATLTRVILLVFIGIPLLSFATRRLKNFVSHKFTPQNGLLVGKIAWYGGLITLFIIAFQQLGFSLAPLLGAAGVVGIALGFASQTSVSNIISGLFLVTEKPFAIGDVITVDNFSGEVLSIDTLSVKLRTFDNRFVRIPNEYLIKAQLVNMTYFPIRRVDLKIGVAYKEDLRRVRRVLEEVLESEPLALKVPEPLIIFEAYGASSIDFTIAVWGQRTEFIPLRNSLIIRIKETFDQEGIEIPFPHVSLYAGSESEPVSVRLIEENRKKAS